MLLIMVAKFLDLLKQFFLTETANCIAKRWKESMGYRFVPGFNHAKGKSYMSFLFVFFCIFEALQGVKTTGDISLKTGDTELF